MSCKRCNSWFWKIYFLSMTCFNSSSPRNFQNLMLPSYANPNLSLSFSLFIFISRESLSIYLYFFLYFSHWKYPYSSLIFKPESPYSKSNNQNTNQHEKTESPYFKIFCVEYNCRVILSNTEKHFLTQLFLLFENKILTLFLI